MGIGVREQVPYEGDKRMTTMIADPPTKTTLGVGFHASRSRSAGPEAWKRQIGTKPVPARLALLPESKPNWNRLGVSAIVQFSIVVFFVLVPLLYPESLKTILHYNSVELANPVTMVPVAPPPPPPTADNKMIQTNKETPIGITLTGTDPIPGDVLKFSVVGSPTHGTVAPGTVSSNVFYTPNTGFIGTDSFTYKVTDTNGQTATATVNLSVTAAAVTATADTYTANENQALTISAASGVLANDILPGGETGTVAVNTGPSHGTLTLNANGSFTATCGVPTTFPFCQFCR